MHLFVGILSSVKKQIHYVFGNKSVKRKEVTTTFQSEYTKKVKETRKSLTELHKKLCSIYGGDDVIKELMSLRGYTTKAMFDTLKDMGVFKVSYLSEISLVAKEYSNEQFKDFGLLTSEGDYLMPERYVLPIRDIKGEVISLVGWHPNGGTRKYVTAPTIGFSRDTSFFNMDSFKLSWDKFDGAVYVVEGIFDTIALKSIGLPCYGNMGLEMGEIKSQMLTRHSKVVCIPDNDNAGRSVTPTLNSISGKSNKFIWDIKTDNVFVSLPKGVKDTDDLVKFFDCYEDLIKCLSVKVIKKIKED